MSCFLKTGWQYIWIKMWSGGETLRSWTEITHLGFKLFGPNSWPVYLHHLEVVKTDCYHRSKANQKQWNLTSHLDLGSSFLVFRTYYFAQKKKKKKITFEPDEARWLTRLELLTHSLLKEMSTSGYIHYSNIAYLLLKPQSTCQNESNKPHYQGGEKWFSDMYGRFLDHYN